MPGNSVLVHTKYAAALLMKVQLSVITQKLTAWQSFLTQIVATSVVATAKQLPLFKAPRTWSLQSSVIP